MADEEEALQQKANLRFIEIMIPILHDQQLKKFNETGHKFPWGRQDYPQALICNVSPDRGTITLSEDGFWWLPVIEQPGQMKRDYTRFPTLEEAVTWVEQKIPELRAENEEWEKK